MTNLKADEKIEVYNGYEWVEETSAPRFCKEHGLELERQSEGRYFFDTMTGQKIWRYRLHCPYYVNDYDMHGCYDYHDTRGFFTFTCKRCGHKEKNEGGDYF